MHISPLLTFTAWSRPFPETRVGTPETKMGEKASALPPSSTAPQKLGEASQPPSSGPGVDAQHRPRLHTQGLALPWGQGGCQGDRLPRAAIHHRSGARGWGGAREGLSCACDHATTIWGRQGQRDGSCLLGTTENIVSVSAGCVRLTLVGSGRGQAAQPRTLTALSLPTRQSHSCPWARLKGHLTLWWGE